jgi:hypothetical protein
MLREEQSAAGPMDVAAVRAICERITYRPGWELRVGADAGVPWLQWVYATDDAVHGGPRAARGRKWRVSTWSTKSEVVLTAFKAALTNEEHECRERFRYRGQAILGPHFDADELVLLAAHSKPDARARPEAPPDLQCAPHPDLQCARTDAHHAHEWQVGNDHNPGVETVTCFGIVRVDLPLTAL